MHLWNPKSPRTWSDARPVEAEVESIRDQIRLAREAGFKGTLHICHIHSRGGRACPTGEGEGRTKDNMRCDAVPRSLVH